MWRYTLPIERLNLSKDRIIVKNGPGVETFNTDWNYVKTNNSYQLKLAGYNQVPVFTLTEKVLAQFVANPYGVGGSFTYTSAGIVETIDNTKGGQIAFYLNMEPNSSGQYFTGGTKWGTSFDFYLPKNDTGYCTFDLTNGTNTIIPKASETAPLWRKRDYYNPDQDSDSARVVHGYSDLLNITIGSVVVGKYRWYALESAGVYGGGSWNVITMPGPAILESGRLSYWQTGGRMVWEGTTNRTCTNGYVVPGDSSTGCLPNTRLAIITGAAAAINAGLSYTI